MSFMHRSTGTDAEERRERKNREEKQTAFGVWVSTFGIVIFVYFTRFMGFYLKIDLV